MTDLAPHPAFRLIAARIDDVGRRYRVRVVLRGLMLWLAWVAAVSVAATMAAHLLRQGVATQITLALWLAWLIYSAAIWLIRPAFASPDRLLVARLIEQRVPGLFNGLTNSVLLAQSQDVQSSPFLPEIFSEVLRNIEQKPLRDAIGWTDLRSLATKSVILTFAAAMVAVAFGSQFTHGLRQLLAPQQFIPQTGSIQILEVQPGNITLVAGQPLEITFTAIAPSSQRPTARLIFQNDFPPQPLSPHARQDGSLQYIFAADHIDQSTQYRIEIGSTQSNWFSVTVVPQIKLLATTLRLTPPAYTRLPPSNLQGPGPFTVPQGSTLNFAVDFNPPAPRAFLGTQEMELSNSGRHAERSTVALADTSLYADLLQGSQLLARLPDPPLSIHVQIDQPPTIHLIWPDRPDVVLPPTRDLTIEADVADDWGLSAARVLLGIGDSPLVPAADAPAGDFADQPTTYHLRLPIHLNDDAPSIRLQVEAADNRNIPSVGGPQVSQSSILRITFSDPDRIAADLRDRSDKLRAILLQMRQTQQDSLNQSSLFQPGQTDAMSQINSRQIDLRNLMLSTAGTFEFDSETSVIQRVLQMLALNPAKQAVDLSAAIVAEPIAAEQSRLLPRLIGQEQLIVSTLDSLLALLSPETPSTQPQSANAPLVSKPEAYQHLEEALKTYLNQQRKTVDQTASLAKVPIEDFDDNQKKQLTALQMSQDKLSSFHPKTNSGGRRRYENPGYASRRSDGVVEHGNGQPDRRLAG
ncbi:MAG: hypothetical protein ABSF29_09090 [Tepidisphaeraceae bacterium]